MNSIKGAFGAVHIATFANNDNYKVALKLLKCEGTTADKEQLIADLDRESKLMQMLHHKFVVQLIGFILCFYINKLIKSSAFIMITTPGELSPSLWTVEWIRR